MIVRPEPSKTTDETRTEQTRILTVVLVPMFMTLLGVSIVNVVLPSIQSSIGASAAALQWVLAGYTLAFGILLVPAGRAGDVYGRAWLFVTGGIIFGVASLLAGFAPNVLILNAARILMGFGSGLLNPQTVGLIQQYFDGAERGRAFGKFGAAVGVSVAVGPVLGGVVVAAFGPEWGWRSAFLINVPIAALAVILAFVWFPTSAWRGVDFHSGESGGADCADPTTAAARRVRTAGAVASAGRAVPAVKGPDLDPVGTVLFTVAIFALMFPFLQGQISFLVAILIPAAVLIGVIWVMWELRYARRGHAPMVDIALFETRSFANGSLLVSVYFLGSASVWVLVAVFLQNGHGFSAFHAGLIGLPGAILSTMSAPWAGNRVFRFGRPLVITGVFISLIGVLGTALCAYLHEMTALNIWWMMLPLSLVGLAGGLVISPSQALSLADVPLKYAGSAGGILQTGQRVATAVGIAGITAVFYGLVPVVSWDGAFISAFAVIAGTMLLSGTVGLIDQLMTRKTARRVES